MNLFREHNRTIYLEYDHAFLNDVLYKEMTQIMHIIPCTLGKRFLRWLPTQRKQKSKKMEPAV